MLSQWLFRRLSTKLAATMLIMLLLSISVTSFMYYQDSTKIISGHVREATQQSAKQSADYLSLILTVASDISQQISRDATVHKVIMEEAAGNLSVDQKFKIKETVDQTLNNVVYTNTFIRSIYLLKEQGSSWGSGLFNISKVRRYTLNDHDWYTNIVSNQVDELWLPLQLDPFSGGGENTELVFTYVKPLRNLYTRETVGAIVINLDGHVILQAIERIRLGKTGKFFVVNAENDKMIEANPEDWSDELLQSNNWHEHKSNENVIAEFEVELDHIPYYVVTHKMERDWLIVGAVPIGEIIGDIQNIQQKIWIYAIGLLLLASLISWLFSKRITSPLKRLMKQMERIEKSNFTAITDITSKDEIGQLSLKFNKMVKQIEYLIEQVNEVEAKKREAEIRALRHQINPHFLYNTLSTIRWMVKLKAYDGVYNGISALVQLMEASMEKKGPFITLRDELDLLEKYMIIQKFRYGSHLQLELCYDERLLSMQLPRMLLQPIVENAVFHGIAPKENGGTVHVTMEESTDKSMLLVTIKDDGIGIPKEKLSELLSGVQQTRAGMFGIGLMHVHETIQLYYGLQSGLHIESVPNEGTTIRLQLALKEVGEGDI